jgi:hypothetical protein
LPASADNAAAPAASTADSNIANTAAAAAETSSAAEEQGEGEPIDVVAAAKRKAAELLERPASARSLNADVRIPLRPYTLDPSHSTLP